MEINKSDFLEETIYVAICPNCEEMVFDLLDQ